MGRPAQGAAVQPAERSPPHPLSVPPTPVELAGGGSMRTVWRRALRRVRRRPGDGGAHGVDRTAAGDHCGAAAAGAAGDRRRRVGQPRPCQRGQSRHRRAVVAAGSRYGRLCDRSAAGACRPRHPVVAQRHGPPGPARGRPLAAAAGRSGLHPHHARRALEAGRGGGGEHGIRLSGVALRAQGGRGRPPDPRWSCSPTPPQTCSRWCRLRPVAWALSRRGWSARSSSPVSRDRRR
jgi:hypothetical protein